MTRHPQGGEGNPPLIYCKFSPRIPYALLSKSGDDVGVTPVLGLDRHVATLLAMTNKNCVKNLLTQFFV